MTLTLYTRIYDRYFIFYLDFTPNKFILLNNWILLFYLMKLNIPIEIRWQRYADGDKDVFGDIYLHYYPDLYAYGRTITSHTEVIDNAIQELFIELWRKSPSNVNSVDQYIYVSFRNQLYRLLKSKRKYFISHHALDQQAEGPLQKSAEDLVIEHESTSETKIQIRKALEALPARRREAIYLKFFQNKSTREISVIMNIREEMVRNYIYKGIKALRSNSSSQLILLHSAFTFLIFIMLSKHLVFF